MALENSVSAVTPSDSADLTNSGILYIGSISGGTTLKVTTTGGDTVTFPEVEVGWFGPLKVERVWSTGTAATSIFVAY